ncbi:hypothetical protein ACPZ19_24075 [Amycolatopsis lurida]
MYFAVLAELPERATAPPHTKRGQDLHEALGALARTWVTRLHVADVGATDNARLGMDLVSEVSSDELLRRPFAQLMKLDAPRRLVRVAEPVRRTN